MKEGKLYHKTERLNEHVLQQKMFIVISNYKTSL